MKISKEQFLKEEDDLKAELLELKRKEDGIFIDGAFSALNYFNSNLKILWILKEAYGDSFDYTKFYNDEFDKFFDDLICGVPRYTWGTIARITNNIVNGFAIEANLGDIFSQKKQIQQSLSKIAFININKNSSDTGGRSSDHNIVKAREYYNDFLSKQIEHLDPDVIICGNTFQFLREKYHYPDLIKRKNNIDYVDHYIIGNKLFLDPYHPGYLAYGKIDAASYINDIVRTIKDCLPLKS